MPKDVKLDEVVKSLLIQHGEQTEHKYMFYLDAAIRGLKELTFDILQQIKSETLAVNSNLTVDLPCDYVNFTRIGLCRSHGRIETLGYDEYLCTQHNVDVCGDEKANDFSGESDVSGGSSRNGELTGGWYGLGGGHRSGYYRIDRDKARIVLSSEMANKSIVLEYVSDTVGEMWQLDTRPDLEQDCVDFIVDEYVDEGVSKDDLYINFLIIKFLSNHCRDAVSSQDLDYMAQQQRGNEI